MNAVTPTAILRSAYLPPAWRVERVDLELDLDASATVVDARLALARDAAGDAPLVLDGQGLELLGVWLDGAPLGDEAYTLTAESLTVHAAPRHCELRTRCRISPATNTALEGLYLSNGMLCTQCEAEGFRRITWYPDRPDVMAVYTVTLRADASRYPVLLANGNRVAAGDTADGRHWVTWHDPHPKPSYLFALVAGDLACVEDRYLTASGRDVLLQIYTEQHNVDQCAYAMGALQRAMAWDEQRYGLEYDLDRYMIVAVEHFNMGAMENKGLNIFNTRYVLASDATATDQDFHGVESVIGHEYFHNWTGNRVTCRDWFQLSLKEGLTVYRDQEFSADMGSAAVQRIDDVQVLRSSQFPQDSGPLAHPVRPDSYIEINNFYTVTVYNKGAEVVRMLEQLLGRDGFRRGIDLYFQRHDGQAVTCDDFVSAMADANGADLEAFRRWYAQAGTPRVIARGRHDAETGEYRLDLRQQHLPSPGQPEKLPLPIPVRVGLLGADGAALPLRLAGEAAPGGEERVLVLRESSQSFCFVDVPQPPVPSLLRGFSAPVILDAALDDEALGRLLAHDPDAFNRWEAGQELMARAVLGLLEQPAADWSERAPAALIEALQRVLEASDVDDALRARLLTPPSEALLAERLERVDPVQVHAARQWLRGWIGRDLQEPLLAAYRRCAAVNGPATSAEAVAARALKGLGLAYLVHADPPRFSELAVAQQQAAGCMTDEIAALTALVHAGVAETRTAALAAFEGRWASQPLVLDKWFQVQATAPRVETLGVIRALLAHPRFGLDNPNKVRALLGSFAQANAVAFHRADGAGYRLLVDQVLELDRRNPQLAARLAQPLVRWQRLAAPRDAVLRGELSRLAGAPALSRDLGEVVGKGLARTALSP